MRMIPLVLVFLLFSCEKNLDYVEMPYNEVARDSRTKIGEVHFVKGSYDLTSAAMKQVTVIAHSLSLYERYNDVQRVRIIGFADRDGDASYNLQLGLARAEQVGRSLENFGVSMNRAKIGSYGENRSFNSKSDFRKVEVWLEDDPLAFLRNQVFVYVFIAALVSFLIGFLTYRLIRAIPNSQG